MTWIQDAGPRQFQLPEKAVFIGGLFRLASKHVWRDAACFILKISDIPKLLTSHLLLWRFDQDHRQKEKRCYSPSSSFFKQQRQRGRS
jgi:hypothetical protein